MDFDKLDQITWAKKPKKIPIVLSKGEVKALLNVMEGLPKMMASLLYGTGMRLIECLRLRVKDIDFDQNQITITAGKATKTESPSYLKKCNAPSSYKSTP